MIRSHRKSIAVACIAVLISAAILPGLCGVMVALFEPSWVLLPDITPSVIALPPCDPDEQPIALCSTDSSRAPPHLS